MEQVRNSGNRSLQDPSQSQNIVELKEEDCLENLGFAFASGKKWSILTVIFLVQTSMNFNASVYGNAVQPLIERYGISETMARIGQMVFLVAYAFGCELWAPWSEELGRRPILQWSMGLVNLSQIPCALAPSYAIVVLFRVFGGLSLAGGSVTLGMVADMWKSDDHQYAIAFVVLSSVGGSIIGPVAGAFIEQYLSLSWNFWIQLILGVSVQLIHYFTVPETRSSILVTNEARKRRRQGETSVFSTAELNKERLKMKDILKIWIRPFHMLLTEPIVLFLSLLSGFSDALIFTFLSSYGPVYKQWGFGTVQTGLAFVPIGIGYIVAYFIWIPFIRRERSARRNDPGAATPESRLLWLLWTAPLLSIGLFGFAWTSIGPPRVHWASPMFFSLLIGIANFSIYGATIDYMVESYGPYSASATGGNGFARDFLAGVSAMYATPLYANIGGRYHLSIASTLLAVLAVIFTIPIYLFSRFGSKIRRRSRFAQRLLADRTRMQATEEKLVPGNNARLRDV